MIEDIIKRFCKAYARGCVGLRLEGSGKIKKADGFCPCISDTLLRLLFESGIAAKITVKAGGIAT